MVNSLRILLIGLLTNYKSLFIIRIKTRLIGYWKNRANKLLGLFEEEDLRGSRKKVADQKFNDIYAGVYS